MKQLVNPMIASLAVVVACLAPVASLAVGEDVRALLRDLLIQVPARELNAPPFSLSDTNGAPVRLADYKGRAVMIYFWTTY
jgi:cytochrome oxidase Cu insertion factor (SCO1/SenC/PrrC family)